jgi:hypothetical protein
VTAIYIPLKPVMRASPVITTIDPPGARGKVGMFTANGITPLSIIINPNGFYVTGQDPGTTAVSHIEFAYEADARL